MAAIARWSLWTLWTGAALLGGAGIVQRLASGHHAAAYGSYVVWGLWVSAYIYFIGLSAGAFLLSSLVYVFGVRRLERIGRLALFVAVVTLFMALCSIVFDLGRMDRFYRVFTSPNFTSMMAWMIWLYTGYFLVLAAELWFALRPPLARWAARHGWRGRIGRALSLRAAPLDPAEVAEARAWLRWLAAAGIPLAFAFHGGVGALFGTVSARAYWHSGLTPILFLTGALVSGGALMTFTVGAFWPVRDASYRETVALLGRVVLGLLLFDLLLEWAEFSIPLWYGVGPDYVLVTRVLFSEFWWVFWGLHILLGSAVPIGLLVARGRQPWAVGLAGLLVATTFLAVRLNLVIPGLIEPNLRELETAFRDHRLLFHYVPSFFEWQVTLGVVAMGAALFYLGWKFLPLTEEEATA
jgi:molybdopterin-containing oxidoreductase family membrane subunit